MDAPALGHRSDDAIDQPQREAQVARTLTDAQSGCLREMNYLILDRDPL